MISRDIRYAFRSFRREPGFVVGVVLNFALAIGASAGMFGLVNRLLFAPPPGITESERVALVGLILNNGSDAFTVFSTSYPVFQSVAGTVKAFDHAAAFRSDTVTLGRGADIEQVSVVQATGNYFTTLGVRAAAGRLFGTGDDVLPAGNDVVVLGHAFWQRKFSGDAAAIGGLLLVDGQVLTVVGVAPKGFNGTALSATDLFVPLSTAMRRGDAGWWTRAGMNVVSIVARLREDVSTVSAAELVSAALRGTDDQSDDRLTGVSLLPLSGAVNGRMTAQGRIALWSTGVAIAVLLIATANAGTLLLLRAARRRSEIAVRLALGSRPGLLVRQSLIEGVALALAGALVGVVLSRWLSDAIRVTLLPGLAPTDGFIDWRVFITSILAALGAGLLAGLSPLVQWRRTGLTAALREGGGHGSSRRFIAQHVLVGFQVALCTVLLIGAALFVRSMQRVQAQDLGFSTARLLYVTIDFRGALSGRERDLAYEEAVRRVRTVPGVVGATVTQGMPFASHHIPAINIPGYELPPPSQEQLPILYAATPEYLDLMDVELIEGRLFTELDTRTAPLVALVNESMARKVWRGQSAIGRCIRAGMGDPSLGDPMTAASFLPCRQVVGVVRDSRARSLRTEGNEARLMQYYVPFLQVPEMPFPDMPNVHAMLVEVAGDPARLVTPVQRIIHAGASVPVYAHVRPYQELLDPQLRSWRLGASLFSIFGMLALGIAALGLFAVVSYLVTQRTQEIGVRLALGGSRRAVAMLVVRDAVKMTAFGAAFGIVVVMLGGSVMQSMLFQTSSRDPVIVAAVGLLLLGVAIAAAIVPAKRASGVEPMAALRKS